MGGTGVAPVKSGVAPDLVQDHSLLVKRKSQCQSTSPNGFGRDAQNDRPEACATNFNNSFQLRKGGLHEKLESDLED